MKASPAQMDNQQNSAPMWFGLDPSVMLRREQAEKDMILLRWVLLAAATLYLLFSGNVRYPLLGWAALLVGAAMNGFLVYYGQRKSFTISMSIAVQCLDILLLETYTAALYGGIARHLPLYTTMLIMSTIRFGISGTATSSVLGLGISVAAILGAKSADSAPTLSVIVSTIIADAALLGYSAYLGYRQHLTYQDRESRLNYRISEITILHEVSSTAHDLKSEDTLQNIVEIVTQFMGFQRAALFLTDSVGEMIPRWYHSYRSEARSAGMSPLSMERGLFEAMLKKQSPIVIDGSQGSPDIGDEPALQIAVPLHSDEGPLGVLVADSNDRRSTSRSDMAMLSSLAKSATVAIENASLHRRVARMANHDGVTDLYNHRYFQERLREMLEAAEGHWPVSLLMIEIDKFKRYNDTFGHRQGDTALYSLSRALEQSTQSLDGIVARYGGDEFVAILPRISRDGALQVTRQIRDQVYQIVTGLLAEQNLPPVMLSIGVATYPDDAQTAGDLIEAADQAMYVVKHSGGNRVHAFSDSRMAL
jgi:diguanylate cyclase (GGDEF)-like protein